MKGKLLEVCPNCGCQRYMPCRCMLPNPKSQTQIKKVNRKKLLTKIGG